MHKILLTTLFVQDIVFFAILRVFSYFWDKEVGIKSQGVPKEGGQWKIWF